MALSLIVIYLIHLHHKLSGQESLPSSACSGLITVSLSLTYCPYIEHNLKIPIS